MNTNESEEKRRQQLVHELLPKFVQILAQAVGKPPAACLVVIIWPDDIPHVGEIASIKAEPHRLMKLGDSLLRATMSIVSTWKRSVNTVRKPSDGTA